MFNYSEELIKSCLKKDVFLLIHFSFLRVREREEKKEVRERIKEAERW